MSTKKRTARKKDDEDDKKVIAESKQEEKKIRTSSRVENNKATTKSETKVVEKVIKETRKTSKSAPKEEKKQDTKKKSPKKIPKEDIEEEASADDDEAEKTTTKASKASNKKSAKETPSKAKAQTRSEKKGKNNGKAKKDMEDEDEEEAEKEEKKKEEKEQKEKEEKKTKKTETKTGKTKKNEKAKKEEKDDKEEEKEAEKEEEEEEKAETKKGKDKKKGSKKTHAKAEKKDDENDGDNEKDSVTPQLKKQLTGNFDTGDGNIPVDKIKISSWNVNGLRAAINKGNLQNYLKTGNLDIICFNETKIDEEKLNDSTIHKSFPPEYHLYFNCCKTQAGYSGTGIATKYKPMAVYLDLGVPKHDTEGRTITLEFEHFFLISCYVPNAGQGLNRLDYRTKEWDVDFRKFIVGLKQKKHVIWCGDLNVAHQEIDIYDPKGNRNKTAGFTDREREEFSNLLKEGFVDSFRELHPTEVKYSWWSVRTGARKVNKGWRLDYFVIDKEGMKSVVDSMINNDIEGSDHCPIELVFNPNFT